MVELWRTGIGLCVRRHEPGHVCKGPVEGHHAITRQALRKRGLAEFQWDRRNRVALCERAHLSHHTRSQPLPYDLLPPAVLEFAADVDLVWLLERVYVRTHG